MIIVPREMYALIIYALSAASMLFCAVVVLGMWWESRLPVFASITITLLSLSTAALALALLQFPHASLPLSVLVVGSRVAWAVALVAAPLSLMLGVLALNGQVSQMRGILFFWRRFWVLAVLVATLYLVTSCVAAPSVSAVAPPASANAPRQETSERLAFSLGATWGCAGMVMSLAETLLVPLLGETRSGILLMCRNYADMITRLVWDGEMLEDGNFPDTDPRPRLWPYTGPT